MAAPTGFSIALDDNALTVTPTWTRIDTPAGSNPIRGWSITRGRNYELDKTATGTASVTFRDTKGILDPTNPGSPYWDSGNSVTKLDPLRQAAIALQNPVTLAWSTLFRGFIEEISAEVDTSEVFMDGQIDLVDAMDILEGASVIPDNRAALIPGESLGDSFYDVQQVDDRIKAALLDAGWPLALQSIFTGNVEVKAVVYSPRSSILSVIQDAADAEFPGVANFYVSKTGIVTFHGRKARFDFTNPTYGIQTWSCGDTAVFTGDPTIIPLYGLSFDRSKSHIINESTATPQDIEDSDIAGQLYDDSTSITKYGHRSVDFENLITNGGDTGGGVTISPNAEVKLFSQYYVDNYKVPQNRIKQLVFKPLHPTHPNASVLWSLMCDVELNDVITAHVTHPGGGGFNAQFFVEGIHYEAEPFTAAYPNVTMTLDVSPVAYFASDPF